MPLALGAALLDGLRELPREEAFAEAGGDGLGLAGAVVVAEAEVGEAPSAGSPSASSARPTASTSAPSFSRSGRSQAPIVRAACASRASAGVVSESPSTVRHRESANGTAPRSRLPRISAANEPARWSAREAEATAERSAARKLRNTSERASSSREKRIGSG